MNERYRFRGKRSSNKNWVYGDLFRGDTILSEVVDTCAGYHKLGMHDTHAWKIDRSTAGQCTGLCDKNGTLIFEGDIVQWVDSDDNQRIDTVTWLRGGLCLCNGGYTVGSYTGKELIIIGNIHDTPEHACTQMEDALALLDVAISVLA